MTAARRRQRGGDESLDVELIDLPPAARWREWMLRVEAAIFASARPVPREALVRLVGEASVGSTSPALDLGYRGQRGESRPGARPMDAEWVRSIRVTNALDNGWRSFSSKGAGFDRKPAEERWTTVNGVNIRFGASLQLRSWRSPWEVGRACRILSAQGRAEQDAEPRLGHYRRVRMKSVSLR